MARHLLELPADLAEMYVDACAGRPYREIAAERGMSVAATEKRIALAALLMAERLRH